MKYAIFSLMLAVVSGCIPLPHKEYSSPRITGIVVDSQTTEKISGATIKLYPWNDTNNETAVTSDTNGKFTIEQLKHWRATYPIMGDPIMYGYITVSFKDYIAVKREYFLSTGELFVDGGPIYQFGLIKLERKNAPNK